MTHQPHPGLGQVSPATAPAERKLTQRKLTQRGVNFRSAGAAKVDPAGSTFALLQRRVKIDPAEHASRPRVTWARRRCARSTRCGRSWRRAPSTSSVRRATPSARACSTPPARPPARLLRPARVGTVGGMRGGREEGGGDSLQVPHRGRGNDCVAQHPRPRQVRVRAPAPAPAVLAAPGVQRPRGGQGGGTHASCPEHMTNPRLEQYPLQVRGSGKRHVQGAS
jgi:hypothetical protein